MGITVHYTIPSVSLTERAKSIIQTILDHGYDNGVIAAEDLYDGFAEPEKPMFNGDIIVFNGINERGHETFGMDFDNAGEEDFCKTAMKPYHRYVVAILHVLSLCQALGMAEGLQWDDEAYGSEEYNKGIGIAEWAMQNHS